jgi:ornithine cyclodeaminase/alanine dehydrogenase-like protein (mu-crystallin family)
MRFIAAEEIDAALDFPVLIAALKSAFRADFNVPLRHHHAIEREGETATLLLMPAWTSARAESFLGAKIVTVFPGNVSRGAPSVTGVYLLLSGETGMPLAAFDGRALTLWRTAAASALAAAYLAREDADHLLLVGAGALAPYLIRAHASVRPIRKVSIWNRTVARAEALAASLQAEKFDVSVVQKLEDAASKADIVSCATLSSDPVVRGAWMKAGAHLDLVGGFTPAMRETDDDAIERARVYVDTRAGVIKEAGDIADPLRRGILREEDIRGDLFELCRGTAKGRAAKDEITLFKSVGSAIEDLAAAMLLWKKSGPS